MVARGHRATLFATAWSGCAAEENVDGVRVIRLETGVRQPESLALYRRHGYTERGPFGSYQRDPLSTFFEKWIA